MKKILIFLTGIAISTSLFSQLSLMKLVGKNSKDHKTGFGAFYFIDFPINKTENRRIVLELIDIGVFRAKTTDYYLTSAAYASFKLGYRYIFSDESKTGFFVEPQAGYCLTGIGEYNEELSKGIALAFITGYSLEVGQRGNSFVFGLKWESDLANNGKQLNTIGLRVAFSYSLFGGRNQ